MNLIIIIIGLILGFTGGYIYSFYEPDIFGTHKVKFGKHTVYVDAERVISHVITELKKKTLSEEEMEKAVLEAKTKFQTELRDYSYKYKAIIFSSPKALAGAEDVTEYFLERLP